MSDSDPPATFVYVETELDRLGIAYLHVVEPRIKGTAEISHGQAPIAAQHLRPKFSRTLIAAGGFNQTRRGPSSHLEMPTSLRSAATSSHLKAGSSGAAAAQPAAQPLQPDDLLWWRRARVHRLPAG
jgi:hypothetical protein